jgi:hypothetical protein
MHCIDRFRSEVKRHLAEKRIFDWTQEIPSHVVEDWRLELAPKTRNRIWTVELMLWFWVVAGFYRERSFKAVTSEVWAPLCAHDGQLATQQVNEGRMAEGRARVPLPLIRRVREHFARMGVEEGKDYGLWRGCRIVWVDGSTVSLADTPELRQHFGQWSNQHGMSAFPLARLLIWGVAGTRIVIASAYGPSGVSEKDLFLRGIDCLRMDDLVVMDRYFAAAELFVRIRRRGANALTRLHSQFKLKKHHPRKIRPNEWIVELPLDPRCTRRDRSLPKSLPVRVVKVTVHTGRVYWLMTTLLDSNEYPAQQLLEVYLQRWGVETTYGELKTELHLAVARSETVEGVYKEIEAHLAAYNYVRLLMVRAACKAHVDPGRLSLRSTVRLLLSFTTMSRLTDTEACLDNLWENLLRQIGTCVNPLRPGRREPRAVKRRDCFPRWRGSRSEWRRANR